MQQNQALQEFQITTENKVHIVTFWKHLTKEIDYKINETDKMKMNCFTGQNAKMQRDSNKQIL